MSELLLEQSSHPNLSGLSQNALWLLRKRYLRRDEKGRVVETPTQMFQRVSKAVAMADLSYDGLASVQKTASQLYDSMTRLEFLPNSPTLMNAGTPQGQLSACFVLPVEDSIEGIFSAVKSMALIQKTGGGTGFSFSKIRPKSDVVQSTMGLASGPVSFMHVFDQGTDIMQRGGRRRGANIGVLRVDHPDILEFIQAKSTNSTLSNFNLSVAVTDDFMEKVRTDQYYFVTNPRTGNRGQSLSARKVFRLMAKMAWKTGDPGIIFIDEVNRCNPTPEIGAIESTNPCGEAALLPYESCNLGSINLSRMVEDGAVAWGKLQETTKLAVHILDNVIEINNYPLTETANQTKGNRKIGLGVMGFADLLIQLQIPYDSRDGLRMAERIMGFISRKAIEASTELAEKRGPFPNFRGSKWERDGYKPMRNATLTTIAPTGSISIIAGCSSGIEPIFAVSYVREAMEGTSMVVVNRFFEETAESQGFYSQELIEKIVGTGSIQGVVEIPEKIRRTFVTALDISPEWHVSMQATFQRHCDNAVSKTVNLRSDAKVQDVERVFMMAYESKCKGITVFRYGSKGEQVLHMSSVRFAREFEAKICPGHPSD